MKGRQTSEIENKVSVFSDNTLVEILRFSLYIYIIFASLIQPLV